MTVIEEANTPIASLRASINALLEQDRAAKPAKIEPPTDVWEIDPLVVSMAVRLEQDSK